MHELNKVGGHFRATDEETVDLVRRLAGRYEDKTIAAILSKQKRQTGTGLAFTKGGSSRCCVSARDPGLRAAGRHTRRR